MPREIITLLALAALVTACSGYPPDTFRGYPLLKRSEPTILLASTSIYENSPADLSQSNISTRAQICKGLTCTDPNGYQVPHFLVTADPDKPPIPVDELTFAGRIIIFPENYIRDSGGMAYRLLAKGDQVQIAVDHWTPATDPSGLQSSMAQTLARGHLRAEPGTPLPAGTWQGTAILHHIHQPDTFHLADASLVVELNRGEGRYRHAHFHTETPYPHDSADANAPPLEPFSQRLRNFSLQARNKWNTSNTEDFKGSFHGSQHEVAIVVFTNVPRRITGGAILYREVPEEQ